LIAKYIGVKYTTKQFQAVLELRESQIKFSMLCLFQGVCIGCESIYAHPLNPCAGASYSSLTSMLTYKQILLVSKYFMYILNMNSYMKSTTSTCRSSKSIAGKCNGEAVDYITALQLAPLAEVLPHGVLQRLGAVVLGLEQVAHRERPARLHEGPHATHVVFMLAVALSAETVHQLVALHVVFGGRYAMVEDAVAALGAHPMCEVHAEIAFMSKIFIH